MKLKLDENVHVDVRRALAEQGYDVATVRDEGLRGHPDVDVLTAAGEEARCLVTLDSTSPTRFTTRRPSTTAWSYCAFERRPTPSR